MRRQLIAAAVLVALAAPSGAAGFEGHPSEWSCFDGSICFDGANIQRSQEVPGQMLILGRDKGTGERGWVAVDCAARIAAGDSPVMPIEDGSALAAACDTWGTEE